ncbi:MAG: hypothetical protein ACLVBI_08300 [Dialister invisus]
MRTRGMFFRENPFYLLGVHSRDTAEAIRTASLEKQGAAKSREEKHMYRMAEERLLHESSRFRAELSWLCGMGKERAYSLIGGTGNMESGKICCRHCDCCLRFMTCIMAGKTLFLSWKRLSGCILPVIRTKSWRA